MINDDPQAARDSPRSAGRFVGRACRLLASAVVFFPGDKDLPRCRETHGFLHRRLPPSRRQNANVTSAPSTRWTSLGFSYGFRLALRVADRRILRLVRGWLRAGVLDGEEWSDTTEGTPQDAGHHLRQWQARGKIVIVRYADDLVMGFQSEADARRRMVKALEERLAKFGLTLNEDKTRLIEFGKLAAELRRKRRPAARDVRVSRLHALLRVEPSRAIRREASHRPSPAAPQAAHRPGRTVAPNACAALGATPLVVQRASRPLPLLRSADQLALDERVLRRNAPGLVSGASSPEPAPSHVDPIPAVARALPPSDAIHHTSPPGPCLTSCSTSGGAACGKVARSDLWGRKPNG